MKYGTAKRLKGVKKDFVLFVANRPFRTERCVKNILMKDEKRPNSEWIGFALKDFALTAETRLNLEKCCAFSALKNRVIIAEKIDSMAIGSLLLSEMVGVVAFAIVMGDSQFTILTGGEKDIRLPIIILTIS